MIEPKAADEKTSSALTATPSIESPTSPENLAKRDITVSSHLFGVWRLKVAHPNNPLAMGSLKYHRDFIQSLPLFLRLARDIYDVSPRLFVIYLAGQVWSGVDETLLMHFSGVLLKTVENGLKTGSPDVKGICTAIVARWACAVAVGFMNWQGELASEQLEARVTAKYDMYLMNARLKVDLPTSKGKSSESEATADTAWESLNDIIRFFSSLLSCHVLLWASDERCRYDCVYEGGSD
ncbi:hypothetical protein CVT24_002568 [Panaeolus cyanescens]|uniref:Uncharacterized protein n=1 Tax=Panaeolus cyanescens TaxID=181874 RepID=A0A409YTZ6_9AGAR|nr:hypothetical protein CVT24_002568 [Panaeolus cyanescens]